MKQSSPPHVTQPAPSGRQQDQMIACRQAAGPASPVDGLGCGGEQQRVAAIELAVDVGQLIDMLLSLGTGGRRRRRYSGDGTRTDGSDGSSGAGGEQGREARSQRRGVGDDEAAFGSSAGIGRAQLNPRPQSSIATSVAIR